MYTISFLTFFVWALLLSHNDILWAYRITKSHREQGLDNRKDEELSWCPSCSNSLWQGWSFGLVHCPGVNATDPIWRVLASSLGISSWTPLKTQHSNPNPLANQHWYIDFLTHPTPLIIPHRLPAFLASLMPLKNWCSIHACSSRSSLKHSIRFCGIFTKFKTEFYCISFIQSVRLHFFKFPSCDNLALVGCIPIAAVAVHLNLKSQTMVSYLIKCIAITYWIFEESTTILNTYTKKVCKLIVCTSYVLVYSDLKW